MPEPYQKLPKELHGKLNPSGRTVLARGGDLIAPEVRDAPAATVAPDAPRRKSDAGKPRGRVPRPAKAEATSDPPPCAVERPASWPDEWHDSGLPMPVHAGCLGALRVSRAGNSVRVVCPGCSAEWWRPGNAGRWERVGTR